MLGASAASAATGEVGTTRDCGSAATTFGNQDGAQRVPAMGTPGAASAAATRFAFSSLRRTGLATAEINGRETFQVVGLELAEL